MASIMGSEIKPVAERDAEKLPSKNIVSSQKVRRKRKSKRKSKYRTAKGCTSVSMPFTGGTQSSAGSKHQDFIDILSCVPSAPRSTALITTHIEVLEEGRMPNVPPYTTVTSDGTLQTVNSCMNLQDHNILDYLNTSFPIGSWDAIGQAKLLNQNLLGEDQGIITKHIGNWEKEGQFYVYSFGNKKIQIDIETGFISCETNQCLNGFEESIRNRHALPSKFAKELRQSYAANARIKHTSADTLNRRGKLALKRVHNVGKSEDRYHHYSITSNKFGSYIRPSKDFEDKVSHHSTHMNDVSEEDLLLMHIGELLNKDYQIGSSKIDILCSAVAYIEEAENKLRAFLNIPLKVSVGDKSHCSASLFSSNPVENDIVDFSSEATVTSNGFQDSLSSILNTSGITSSDDSDSKKVLSSDDLSLHVVCDDLYPISTSYLQDDLEEIMNGVYRPISSTYFNDFTVYDQEEEYTYTDAHQNSALTNICSSPFKYNPDLNIINSDVNMYSVSKPDLSSDCLCDIHNSPFDDFLCMNSPHCDDCKLLLHAPLTLSPIKFNQNVSVGSS